jgi:hypothetical protein
MRSLVIAGHTEGPPDAEGRYPTRLAVGQSHAWLAVRHHAFACGDTVIMARCACGVVGWSLFTSQHGCGPGGHGPLRDTGLGDSDQFDTWHRAFLSTLDLRRYTIGRIWTNIQGQALGN